MTTATAPRPASRVRIALGAGVAALVGLPVGLFGSALAPFLVGLLGIAAATVGVVGTVRRSRWGLVVLVLGAALLLGAAVYVVLGLIQPDGPASGGGFGGPPAP